MSDLATSLREHTLPELEKLAGGLADDFLGGLRTIFEGASNDAKAKVEDLIKKGYSFKQKALTADDQDLAREYAEAVETTVRRVRTVLLAEALVAEESTASLIGDLFEKALDGLATIAKGLITTIAAGLVKGGAAGITGGEGEDGTDPSSIFPFA